MGVKKIFPRFYEILLWLYLIDLLWKHKTRDIILKGTRFETLCCAQKQYYVVACYFYSCCSEANIDKMISKISGMTQSYQSTTKIN